MLKLNQLTNHAITLLGCLASHSSNSPLNTKDLATMLRLSRSTTAKILKSLTRQGILVSHRGTLGGYQLAKKPHDLSLADVVQALEYPSQPKHRSSETNSTTFVHKTIMAALTNITLYEVAERFSQETTLTPPHKDSKEENQ